MDTTMTTTSIAEKLSITAVQPKPAGTSILKRLFDAFVKSQQRRAERAVVSEFAKRGYLADRGSLTDRIEREIQDRLYRQYPL
jgi:hypothetical protein